MKILKNHQIKIHKKKGIKQISKDKKTVDTHNKIIIIFFFFFF